MDNVIPLNSRNINDMSVDMQREYAYSAYISAGNTKEAAETTGLPEKRIRKWVSQLGWELDKKEHFDIVHDKISEKLNTQVAEMKANSLVGSYRVLNDLLTRDIHDIEINEVERAKAVKDMVESISKLEGTILVEQDGSPVLPGISAKNQQIFMNIVNEHHDV